MNLDPQHCFILRSTSSHAFCEPPLWRTQSGMLISEFLYPADCGTRTKTCTIHTLQEWAHQGGGQATQCELPNAKPTSAVGSHDTNKYLRHTYTSCHKGVLKGGGVRQWRSTNCGTYLGGLTVTHTKCSVTKR